VVIARRGAGGKGQGGQGNQSVAHGRRFLKSWDQEYQQRVQNSMHGM
jgi:hypothetical protein